MLGHKVNDLIQRMCRRPETIARLNADPEAVFAEFGLDEGEREALRAGTPEAMGLLGVHPILQMHYMMARNPGMTKQMSIALYPQLLREM
jgi:2'-aminobiphenyl-2,3-diol 1,2-dioxygenase, small subunit